MSPCDDAFFSIQEGECIDVSVPGAIPNWVGAPVVKLLPPTPKLQPAPTCQSKGHVERLYTNTCRCARGSTALDVSPVTGLPRGNCTGFEDDTSDNLDKVWCFLENVRDPRDPQSGCYPDVKWSERDARFWSSLACFESPDIEGGVKRKVKDKSQDPVLTIKEDPEFLIVNERESLPKRTTTSTPSTSSTFKPLPVPVFDELDDDDFASVLNTIFQSA